MFFVTKEFRFEAAHRLVGHPKCGNCHGHSYRAAVTIGGANPLPPDGMLIDFGDMKPVKDWIDVNLDHNMLLHTNDPMALLQHSSARYVSVWGVGNTLLGNVERNDLGPPHKPWMLFDDPPTAENIAQYIARKVPDILHAAFVSAGLWVERVVVWETDSCSAEYTPNMPVAGRRI